MSWCHIYYITSVILYIYSGYVTASEYIVSADPNGEDCPSTDLPCYNLSYYTADYASYFTDNTIFYFLEGTHTLQGPLEIIRVSNITLQGLGHIEQGFHETVMQSTSVIRCSDKKGNGIQFFLSHVVVLRSLTIANCAGFQQEFIYSLHFSFTFVTKLEWVSVQNGSGIGLLLKSAFYMLIANSSFANNGANETSGGNALMLYDNHFKIPSRVNIENSNFTMGLGYGMNLSYFNENKAEVIINNSIFSHNTNMFSGGGVSISLNEGGGSIEFGNCIIYNNTAQENGGGLEISVAGNGSIEFSNCTIYNNTAQEIGGGLEISVAGGGSIEFSNCTIYNNTAQQDGGGVEIGLYGEGIIEFGNCIIYNNTAQENGGGLEISVAGNGSIEFSNCTIYNNTAQEIGGGLEISVGGSGSIDFNNCTIYNNTAQLEGGGVDIISIGSGSIEFGNCTIYNNTCQLEGGGVSIYLSGYSSVEFDSCTIYNNTAQQHGGGVYITFFSLGIEFRNCTISNNTAQQYGGGVFVDSRQYGIIEFCNCTIYNNIAYLGSALALYTSRAATIAKTGFYFKNVLVHFNKVTDELDIYRSAVVLINIKNVTFDQIEVSNHNGTGLIGVNSLITFAKNSTFVNNSGIYGGGIALYESSRLLLKEYTNVSFINNHASQSGGGIFVSQALGYSADFTTDCTFEVIPQHNADDNNTVLYFVKNTADISGDVLYGGKINDCRNNLFFDHLFYYPEQTGLSKVSSDPVQVCFCQSNQQDCSITNISIFAIPGIDVNVSLATVGLKNGLTKGMIKFILSDSSLNVKTDNSMLNVTCTNVTLKLSANPDLLNATKINVTLENSIDESFHSFQAETIDITIKSCPIGYPLINDTCSCRSELNTSSITCDINTQIITRHGNKWIGYNNNSECLIVYPHCPFDYCNDEGVHFKITSPDPQCLYNRSGILCGQCAKGLSLMLGSNQCGQCTNNYLALIIPFALAGIALVAFVIALNLTVSVGTINGLIFYANVVKIYEHIFFPKGPIPLLSHFISWLNLDLGIETCFFDGMDSCTKTWLQFIFPGYVWFLLILIIILSRYSSKVVRLVGRQAIPVLATMILLSYTKLIRIVFMVLHYTHVPCSGEKNVLFTLWYIDATVPYFRGCHIALFLFSLVVFILLIIPYTFYLLTIPLFEGPLSKYICCQKLSTYMKPFFDAYGGPYKDKCRFWTGFLLLVRVVLALTVSVDTEATVSLYVLTSILVVIIFMYLPLRVYRQLPLVYLELFFILNIVLLASTNGQTSNKNMNLKGEVSTIVLVSLTFVVFCGILIYHVWDRFLKSCLREQIQKPLKTQSNIQADDDANDLLTILSANTVTYSVIPKLREPLLDNQNDIPHKK